MIYTAYTSRIAVQDVAFALHYLYVFFAVFFVLFCFVLFFPWGFCVVALFYPIHTVDHLGRI
jgi:hypothetical protein